MVGTYLMTKEIVAILNLKKKRNENCPFYFIQALVKAKVMTTALKNLA